MNRKENESPAEEGHVLTLRIARDLNKNKRNLKQQERNLRNKVESKKLRIEIV